MNKKNKNLVITCLSAVLLSSSALADTQNQGAQAAAAAGKFAGRMAFFQGTGMIAGGIAGEAGIGAQIVSISAMGENKWPCNSIYVTTSDPTQIKFVLDPKESNYTAMKNEMYNIVNEKGFDKLNSNDIPLQDLGQINAVLVPKKGKLGKGITAVLVYNVEDASTPLDSPERKLTLHSPQKLRILLHQGACRLGHPPPVSEPRIEWIGKKPKGLKLNVTYKQGVPSSSTASIVSLVAACPLGARHTPLCKKTIEKFQPAPTQVMINFTMPEVKPAADSLTTPAMALQQPKQ